MAGFFLQAFSLSLALVYVNGHGDTFCDTKPGVPFDFYYFVQQWPGALCSRGCCYSRERPLPGRYFRPHGLWPAYMDGTSMCYCEPRPNDFNRRMGRQLQEEMMVYWGSISCPLQNPSNFYEHQWRKHGACTGMHKDQYFQEVMDLYFQYDLAAAFRDSGIFPDWGLYEVRDLKNAVMEVSGSMPIITCNFNTEHQVRQLSEIFICLDKAMKPFHCPTPKFTLCTGAPIAFPAFDPSYTDNPTHRAPPRRIPGGRPRNFYKPGIKIAAGPFNPTQPLTALCMDPTTPSAFLYGQQGQLIKHTEYPFHNASLDRKPTRAFVP